MIRACLHWKGIIDMKVLVIDVGGTNIKIKVSNKEEIRKFPSGPDLSAKQMVSAVLENSEDWAFDCVTIGFPGPVVNGKIKNEPVNLGTGWVNMDFEKALGKPVRIINDAAMQALGCYEGGRMLFLGLGTGLGTTLIVDGVVAALEAGHLPFKKNRSFEHYVGVKALNRTSRKHWQENVFEVVKILKDAMVADYVVLGGGNVKKLDELPPGTKKGDNHFAFLGGVRFWDNKANTKAKKK
jgi:predicted NBD/HSP70 family sugar kinase